MNFELFTRSIILFLFVPVQGGGYEALIFDRFNFSLFDLPNNIPQDEVSGAWALVCPAQSKEEKEFADRYSFTSNALFVKQIYRKGGKASNVKKDVCEEPFKLSLAFHVRSSTFQFGFEIYYHLSQVGYFHESVFDDYKSLKETVPNLKTLLKKGTFIAGQFGRIVHNALDEGSRTELWFNEDMRIGFMWIKLVKFTFNSSNLILKTIAYDIGTNSRWPVVGERCENYSLGDEIYDGFPLDTLYSQTGKMFNDFKFSSTPCPLDSQCFKKVLLIPMDQFRFGSSTPLCSNLATIPIWTSTETEFLLKKVDQFIYALYRVAGQSLRIVAGVSNKRHQYTKKKGWKKSTLYFDLMKKKVPIPKVIYKIVEFREKSYKKDKKRCWYSAIIVIHNDPFFKSSNRICTNTITNEWGLETSFSGADNKIPETIYVCERNRNTMKKLVGLVKGSIEPAKSLILTLSEFPNSPYVEKDIRSQVNTMLEKLIREGDNHREEESKIMELPADIDNPDDKALLSGEENGTQEEEREDEVESDGA